MTTLKKKKKFNSLNNQEIFFKRADNTLQKQENQKTENTRKHNQKTADI